MTNLLLLMILLALPGAPLVLAGFVYGAVGLLILGAVLVALIVVVLLLVQSPLAFGLLVIVAALLIGVVGPNKRAIKAMFAKVDWNLLVVCAVAAILSAGFTAAAIVAYLQEGLTVAVRVAAMLGTIVAFVAAFVGAMAFIFKLANTYPQRTIQVANPAMVGLASAVASFILGFSYVSERTDGLFVGGITFCVLLFAITLAAKSAAKDTGKENAAISG